MATMKTSKTLFMMMMFIVASMQMHSSMAQTRHVVGDALGWTIPPNGAAEYTTWASQQTFNVGDTLFFNFTTGFHDATEVSQAAYGPCTITNPISTITTGPATVTLTTAGTHYYICTVGAHCQLGQKLTINVSAASAAPPTTPPQSSPPTTMPPSSPPTTMPPSSPPTTTPAPQPTPVSPPTTTPSPAPTPSTTTTPPPTSSPPPSSVGATPPSPTTSDPSSSNTPTTSPASDTTPPPPSPSTATRSFTAVVPATFLAIALAFFY